MGQRFGANPLFSTRGSPGSRGCTASVFSLFFPPFFLLPGTRRRRKAYASHGFRSFFFVHRGREGEVGRRAPFFFSLKAQVFLFSLEKIVWFMLFPPFYFGQ